MTTPSALRIPTPLFLWTALMAALLLAPGDAPAQVQHPLAARRVVHRHRVHTHRENVAGAVQDRRQDVAGAVHERRENIADVRRDRVENVADRRAAVATARAILPAYVPATVGSSGSIVCPPAPVTLTESAPPPPPAAAEDDDAYPGLGSDEMPNPFEDSPSYPVTRVEDGGVTVVLKVGQGETKVRMVGVTSVTLADKVNLPQHMAGLRLPSTESYVQNLLKGENVYVVYDTKVAAEDTDKKCVAYLFRAPDGLPINLEIIRTGFGVVDTRYDFDQKDLFNRYQDAARQADKGIYGILQRIKAARAEKQK